MFSAYKRLDISGEGEILACYDMSLLAFQALSIKVCPVQPLFTDFTEQL